MDASTTYVAPLKRPAYTSLFSSVPNPTDVHPSANASPFSNTKIATHPISSNPNPTDNPAAYVAPSKRAFTSFSTTSTSASPTKSTPTTSISAAPIKPAPVNSSPTNSSAQQAIPFTYANAHTLAAAPPSQMKCYSDRESVEHFKYTGAANKGFAYFGVGGYWAQH